jgi:hypothetical protein
LTAIAFLIEARLSMTLPRFAFAVLHMGALGIGQPSSPHRASASAPDLRAGFCRRHADPRVIKRLQPHKP